VGSGWYRISVSETAANSVSRRFEISLADDSGATAYTGDGASRAFFWGAQLETGSTATAYQRVVSQYDVSEAGVEALHYLSFDGTDDGMLTGTITPGVDAVQSWVGIRRLTAHIGVIVEHSATTDANAGSFHLAVVTNTRQQNVGGTTRHGVTSVGAAAPQTEVLCGIGQISTDTAQLRANGVQVGTSANDQGTGNFLAYPLYIGRRAGSSLPFNGHIYGLIVRFSSANLAAAQIANAERWLARKSGVTL
jgi:hypothetical protein